MPPKRIYFKKAGNLIAYMQEYNPQTVYVRVRPAGKIIKRTLARPIDEELRQLQTLQMFVSFFVMSDDVNLEI